MLLHSVLNRTSHRKARVGDLLYSFLADEVRTFRDPRLQLLTITGVDVSPDLKSARVFWSVPSTEYPTKEKIESVQAALDGAVPFLKRRIGEELELRYIPGLRFIYDESMQRADRIDFLLHQAAGTKE